MDKNFSATDIRTQITSDKDRIFADLKEIVAFNSVHNEPGCEEDHRAAGQWVEKALSQAGLSVSAYPTEDGSTAYIGTREAAAGQPTVLLYCHYDVVPAGDQANWESDPFTLTERNGRWYGRGAADCKGNLAMHLAALRAVDAAGGAKVGIKVLVEGSEERGGAGLDRLIETQPELFKADAIMIADSGNVAAGVPTLTTSLRGGAQVDLQVDTLKTPVHSGSFGGAAPDATFALIRLINSLRDENGAVAIDGVDCTRHWDGYAYSQEDFRKDATILDGVAIMGGEDDDVASQVWSRPAISVTGFTSTPVAEAVNAVPATAKARLNLRVPAGLDTTDVLEKLEKHLHAHVPFGAKLTVSIADANQPFHTSPDGKVGTLLGRCLSEAYDGKETVVVGSGGSIPLCSALEAAVPGAEIALYGVEEPECTIHSPNESVSPDEIIAIATTEALFLLNYQK